jgi:beta-lactamase class A
MPMTLSHCLPPVASSLAAAVALLVAGAAGPRAATPADTTAAEALRVQLRQLAADAGAEVGVAARTLDGGDQLLLNADEVFHAASTMKVPVMVELFRQAAAGELSLDDPVQVTNQFASLVDGSPYTLSIDDDSDRDIYDAMGGTRSLRQLCEAMIVVSSNLATNLLIERLGVARIRATVTALGAEGLEVRRGVEDSKAFRQGLNNTTTARGLLVLLEAIAHGRAVSPEASREMVGILTRQRFTDAIPAGLPDGIEVAHKTGSITRIHHDAAIVYAPRPYVLVVLVRGVDDKKQSAALIAGVARAVHAWTQAAPAPATR